MIAINCVIQCKFIVDHLQEVLFTLICSGLYFAASTMLMQSVYRELHFIYNDQVGAKIIGNMKIIVSTTSRSSWPTPPSPLSTSSASWPAWPTWWTAALWSALWTARQTPAMEWENHSECRQIPSTLTRSKMINQRPGGLLSTSWISMKRCPILRWRKVGAHEREKVVLYKKWAIFFEWMS